MCKIGDRHKNFVQNADLISQGWPFGHPDGFWKNSTKTHVAEPRDRPCRPRAPQRIRVSFRLRLGLRSGWNGPTSKVEIDPEIDGTCPARSFVPTSPAHSGSRFFFGVPRLSHVSEWRVCASKRVFLSTRGNVPPPYLASQAPFGKLAYLTAPNSQYEY